MENTAGPSTALVEKLVQDGHDRERVELTLQRVGELLTRGEEILYVATEKRLFLNLTPDSVVITNKRLILYRPQLFGRVSFDDFIWRNVKDAAMKEGYLRATLTFELIGVGTLVAEYIPKLQARRVYAIAQEMEEAMVEDRRNRAIEEKRAAAGGVVIGAVAEKPAEKTTDSADDSRVRLEKLALLQKDGLITEEEYARKRAEILARL